MRTTVLLKPCVSLKDTKKAKITMLPGWTELPPDLTITAQECFLAKIYLANIITHSMLEAGFYYAILAQHYYRLIGAPLPAYSTAYDLTHSPVFHRHKYAPKRTNITEKQEQWIQQIEEYWKASRYSLLTLDKDKNKVIKIIDRAIIENKAPLLPINQYKLTLQQGLQALSQCYGITPINL